MRSAIEYATSEEENGLQASVSGITETGLPNITNEAINNPELGLEKLFDELISTLEKTNERGRYTRSIGRLKGEWKKATERAPKPSDGNT